MTPITERRGEPHAEVYLMVARPSIDFILWSNNLKGRGLGAGRHREFLSPP
jgi:hypothetical protein